MIIGEVVEIKTAFKPNQKDDLGNPLALGSIQVRLNPGSVMGAVGNVYARPAVFNRRIPLIGEHVLLMRAPTNDETSDGVSGGGWIYFDPVNVTDDIVLHAMHSLFTRDQPKKASAKGKRLHDQKKFGYSFPQSPKANSPIQPFEGDVIIEGRFGSSIRLGSSVVGNLSNYQQKPTWKGTSNGDPIMILRVTKPSGGDGYTIEDLKKDGASIYLATTQMLSNFKPGFNKNLDMKTAPNWQGNSQILLDAERIVINANKDKAFVVGKDSVVITAPNIIFQDENYNVALSDLMDWLKAWIDQDTMLAQGSKQYATAAGPTATATNVADYIKLSKVEWQTKFKKP